MKLSLLGIFLSDELARRKRSNSSFSLRAFAKFLDLDPSFLSKVISGKRMVASDTLIKIAKKLAIPKEQLELFQAELLKNSRIKVLPSEFNELTKEQYRVISDWYHYAILELVGTEDFQPQPDWIAHALGITKEEAQSALERLLRLGFLCFGTDGRLVNQSGNNTTVGNNFTDVAFRKLQRSILELGIEALERVDHSYRDQTSMTLSIDPSLIPEARKRIRKFRRELTSFLEQASSRNKVVYHMGFSVYPVSHIQRFERKDHSI